MAVIAVVGCRLDPEQGLFAAMLVGLTLERLNRMRQLRAYKRETGVRLSVEWRWRTVRRPLWYTQPA